MSFVDDWFDVMQRRVSERIERKGSWLAAGQFVCLLFWAWFGWAVAAGVGLIWLLNG